ncbi:hypothetical protein [Nocardia pseudovaccinii]|uniref:hypothetical protein n=1 Tax=Nocardia pseudovaccinii TaxID=189540 RepID=UPI0007A4BA4D|nr:hypothetical protein [Nocardia pseudovaccinii]
MNKIATTLATCLLAVGATAALVTGIAAANPGGTYIGNYATLAACEADGQSPSTGGTHYVCELQADGTYDLYTGVPA